MLPQHSQKPLSLYKFSSKHLVDVRKKYIGATQFLGAQELHSIYRFKKIFVPET